MMMRISLLLIFGLSLTGAASAQTAGQKLMDGFAGRKAPAPTPQRESDARLIEILVELAWLGDPITFPFYIEARMEGGTLHVRGNVPSRAVHEHAMKLAQTNTPLPLADDLKENLGLKVRPLRMPPDQLEKVVRAALRERLPTQAKNLQVRCTVDGQVAVVGNLDTFEQKLAVSQALRRLHGCTVAVNRTRVSFDPDGNLAKHLTRPTAPAQPAATNVSLQSGTGTPALPAQSASSAVPLLPPGNLVGTTPAFPTSTVNLPPGNLVGALPASPVGTAAAPTTPPGINALPTRNDGPRMPAAHLQKRIQDVCPMAREVRVSLEPTGAYKIEIRVRENADIDSCVGRIESNPELANYNLVPYLYFVLDTPVK